MLTALAGSLVVRAYMVANFGFNQILTYYLWPSTLVFFLLGSAAHRASASLQWLCDPLLGALLLSCAVLTLAAGPAAEWDSLRFWVSVLCLACALPGIFRGTHQSRFLNTIGDLSYPVYLLHLLVIMAMSELGVFGALPASGIIVSLVFLTVTTCGAIVTHWILERPTAAAMRLCLKALWCLRVGTDVVPDRPDCNPVDFKR